MWNVYADGAGCTPYIHRRRIRKQQSADVVKSQQKPLTGSDSYEFSALYNISSGSFSLWESYFCCLPRFAMFSDTEEPLFREKEKPTPKKSNWLFFDVSRRQNLRKNEFSRTLCGYSVIILESGGAARLRYKPCGRVEFLIQYLVRY